MRLFGWFIIIGEIIGSIIGWEDFTISSAIMNTALIIAGASFIVVDRIISQNKKDKNAQV